VEPSEIQVSATPVSTQSSESWLVMPEFPSTATQADVGAEIYRLVCQDCHGDRGQVLTDEWRAEGAPEDQNCWQSKCHASNHPPEGFVLPRQIPALVGASTLRAHETVLDLHNYIRSRMPWHDPGSLQEAEYWQVTAFLIRERGLALGDLPLGDAEAANLRLHPNQTAP
jgi:mono/diheme cytochrome c family protein